MEPGGVIPDGDAASGFDLPKDVVKALAALVPSHALTKALRPGSRGSGALVSRHQVPISSTDAAELMGGCVPSSPTLAAGDVVEHLFIHRGPGEGSLQAQLEEGTVRLHLRLVYLPTAARWEQAFVLPMVMDGGSVLDVFAPPLHLGQHGPWPGKVHGHGGGGDFAIVRVGGIDLGVQVDASGVVRLSWVADCPGSAFWVSLLTRREPRAAVELVAGDGLLV